jgi:hypothetical protein
MNKYMKKIIPPLVLITITVSLFIYSIYSEKLEVGGTEEKFSTEDIEHIKSKIKLKNEKYKEKREKILEDALKGNDYPLNYYVDENTSYQSVLSQYQLNLEVMGDLETNVDYESDLNGKIRNIMKNYKK